MDRYYIFVMSDLSSPDADFQFKIMLLERVSKLEDLYLQLERRAEAHDRALTRSSFQMIRRERHWLVRVHLNAATWPTDAKSHRKICHVLFNEMNHFCPPRDTDDYTMLVFCCHNSDPLRLHTLPTKATYTVLEGVITTDSPSISQEGIGAAFDQAWEEYMLRCDFEIPNTVEELEHGPAVARAIHCVNGNITEYMQGDTQDDDYEIPAPDVQEATAVLAKAGIYRLLIQHPRMHTMFPSIFEEWIRWND